MAPRFIAPVTLLSAERDFMHTIIHSLIIDIDSLFIDWIL